ncbi:hypothetical protein [Paenibacillus sacheonensis]|uniref:Right handed beta helix domain-containing protein n=1 Tax=Paenibacillus sacheonensis TaxID=742054 RepID=A0A7X5C444_9BACL|nr:hypothetical protein [Paenibacillus sacheonensis]MBM7567737.1 hypothetical protein [Paenibacillus sacheonensis]NBC71989.1 hypothetical protein [Paenibacillus sacheonensis]
MTLGPTVAFQPDGTPMFRTNPVHRKKAFLLKAALFAFVLGCCMFVLTAKAHAADYYVDCSAGTNGSGTQVSPYNSFNAINGIGTLSAGDRVLLKSGVTCNQQMTVAGQGNSSNYITIDSYGGTAKAKIIRSGSQADRAIKLTNPSYWKINNLEIGSAGTGILVTFSTAGHEDLSFTNLYFHDIYGIHQGSGSGNDSTGDAIWNSAGIEFTSKTFTSSNPASTYIVNNVTFDTIEGYHNLDTISIDWYNSGYMNVSGGHKAAEHVLMNNLNFHNDNAGGGTGCDDGMRLTSVRYLTLINSNLDGEGGCHSDTGTAAIYIAFVSDSYIMNSMFQNVPNTSSPDMVAFDYECCTDNLQINNNYIAGNAGAGISYLAIHPGLGLETNSVAAGNIFINNGSGSFRRAGNSDTPSGTIRDNLYSEPNNFLYQDGANYSGFTLTNNIPITNAAGIYHSAKQFGSSQGASNWTYKSYNGTAWSNLGYYDAAGSIWQPSSTVNVPQVSQFGMHPEPGGGKIIARAWTAPVAGTVSIRGRVLKTAIQGGDGVIARITKNGTRIWPSGGDRTVAYNDRFGYESNLDGVTVAAGDEIRFEITSGAAGDNVYDSVSWSPAVAYTASSIAAQWDFNTAGNKEGWSDTNQIGSSVSGGIWTLTSTGGDPYTIGPNNLNVAASYRYIKIKLKNNTTDTGGKFFFITNADGTYNEAKSKTFTTGASMGGYTEYTIDMGTVAGWTGTIKQLRFDPISTTGTMNVDYILLSNTP